MSHSFTVQGETFRLVMDNPRYGAVRHTPRGGLSWGRNIWALDPDTGVSLNSSSAWRSEECLADCEHRSQMSAAECAAKRILVLIARRKP